jgi:peptidoglycan/xylan/chitin deacetylase (PgdA/CDA1 family)
MAVWVVPDLELYELDPPAHPSRPPWPRPAPDVVNYSMRDYGNRVGFHRMADMLGRHGIRATVAMNAAVCDHFPALAHACRDLDWEIIGHGVYNTRYMHHLDAAEQRQLVRDTRDTIEKTTGTRIRGWLSPGISATPLTPAILAQEGVRYSLDFFHDDQPMPVEVPQGRLISVPYMMEANDVVAFWFWRQTPRRYLDHVKAHFDLLYEEGAAHGTVMCLPLHPYAIGLPHRIGVLDEILAHIRARGDVWIATGSEIVDFFMENCYDTFVDWLDDRERRRRG